MPGWVWVILAVPTIASATLGAAIGTHALVREIRWRRRVRHHQAQVIDLREHSDRRRAG